MIRTAIKADIDRLVAMGLRFVAETGYREFISPDEHSVRALMERLISSTESVIYVVENNGIKAMLGMFVYPHPMDLRTTASEAFWWVEPEDRGTREGLRLVDYGEAWARARGARRIQMIAPNERVASYYRRRGYQKIEEHFSKAIG